MIAEITKENPRAFAVRSRNLVRWDPSSFHQITWHWPKSLMRPIGSVLEARREKVDRSVVKFAELQPITIHFDGSVDRRVLAENRVYTMDLWYAHPGDIVVAKIDLKRGAVGIVPSGWDNVVVTGHFAVYQLNPEVIPQYFHRIIQTRFFKDHLWRNKVGAEGRKEVKLNFFEELEIPIPPLKVQRGIVRRWENECSRAAEAGRQAVNARRWIDEMLYEQLNLSIPDSRSMTRVFASRFADIERWSVSANQARMVASNLDLGRYPVKELDSILVLVQYGTSEKANSEQNGIPVIRMNNIVDGLLDLGNLKHVDLPYPERARLLLKDGDILFNRTNSKELVGKTAVFRESREFVYASYLIRIRLNETVALPDYISHVLNSAVGRQQINALSRRIIGQANINSVELRSLRVPVPPLSIQREIVDKILASRTTIEQQKRLSREIQARAESDLEALIMGTQKL
jgi:type I restriction enzyme, S subunit